MRVIYPPQTSRNPHIPILWSTSCNSIKSQRNRQISREIPAAGASIWSQRTESLSFRAFKRGLLYDL